MTCDNLDQALQAPAAVTSLRLTRQSLDSIARIPWHRFTQLTSLDLSNNAIVRLPKGLWLLPRLGRLFLAGNRINRLPEAVSQLSQLKQLSLEGNRLKEIPPLPATLEVINLSNNRLRAFPAAVLSCPQTRNLYLSNNPITALPNTFSNLPNLRVLQLSGCRLTNLPALPSHLIQLDLSKNKLSELPANWGQLQQLENVNLSHNRLHLEEEVFRHQGKLRFLQLERTSSQLDPAALLDQCPLLEDVQGAHSSQPRNTRIHQFIRDQHALESNLSRELLWQVWQGIHSKALSLSEALQLCDPDHPLFFRIGAARSLQAYHWASVQSLPTARWQLIGTFGTERHKLTKRLAQQKVAVVDNAPDYYILGHEWTNAGVTDSARPVLDERTVIRWLDAKEGRKLTYAKDRKTVESMEKMIWGYRSEGLQEWLLFLEQSGVPDLSLPKLLGHWKKEPPEARTHIYRTIFPYLPLPVQIAWEGCSTTPFALRYLPALRSTSLTARLLQHLVIRED